MEILVSVGHGTMKIFTYLTGDLVLRKKYDKINIKIIKKFKDYNVVRVEMVRESEIPEQ